MKFCIRILSTLFIGASLFTLSALANAADLTIANATNKDLSISINSMCSEFVLEQHVMKVIPEEVFQQTCKDKESNCAIKVFNKLHCAGTHIETIEFNSTDGIVSLNGGDNDGEGNKYYWEANAFFLYVSDY